MGTSEIFLIALTIILALPYAVWRLARTDRFAPLVVVQIIGGILLGPGVLGAAFPGAYAFVFNPPVIGALNGIAWWSVMLFVFAAGLELDLHDAWANRGETFTTAAAALLVPLALGAGAAALLLLGPGWIGPRGTYAQAVLGIGMACAVTALPILVLLMEKLGIFRTPLGDRMLRYASFDDVAIWGVLALILLDWQRIGRQALFLALFGLAAVAMRRVIRRLPENDRWAIAVVWLAATGFAADWSGLHFMVGAFLAGAVLDGRDFSVARRDALREVLLLALMPVFFLSTGLRTQWGAGLHGTGALMVFGAAALFLAASVAGKLLGTHLAGRLLGWAPGEAAVIGWMLQTKALIMIIFVNVLLDRQIITAETFTALLLMAVASTALTVPMARSRLARLGHDWTAGAESWRDGEV
jgi:Kef-type K+ transport system membrane component KefB